MNEQNDIKTHIDMVRESYESSVKNHFKNEKDQIPPELASSPGYKGIQEDLRSLTIGSESVREFLRPEKGMKFLDAGCNGDLAGYNLDTWPCLYYGVDISATFVNAMKMYAKSKNLVIGGLHVSEIVDLPFEDEFFNIVACTGVFEYFKIEYIREAIRELHRCLKKGGKLVVNAPNPDHPYINDMLALEEYLKRPNFVYPRNEMKEAIEKYFIIDLADDSKVLISYFLHKDGTA
jgi:SAM-dependent methyltransferase